MIPGIGNSFSRWAGGASGGVPPAADPADFGTLVAWIDPRYNLTHGGDGTAITAWTSRDTNAHVAGVAGAPTFELDAWNGNPSVLFDGSDDGIYFSTVATPFAGSDVPYFVVAAVQYLAPTLNEYVFCLTNTLASAANSGLTINTNERWCVTRNDGATNKFPTAANFSADTAPHLVAVMCAGTQADLFEDGVKLIDAADVDVNTIPFNSFNLGFRRNSSPAGFAHVRLGPVLVYSALDNAGRQLAEQWLRDQGYDTVVEEVTETFLASGQFSVPRDASVVVECWGGGGGGRQGGGGGGGGAYARSRVPVVGGALIDLTVATASSPNQDGADTTWDTSVVVAKGGRSADNGGLGGTAAASTGTTKFSGGNGGAGAGNQSGGGGAGDVANASVSTGGNHTGAPGTGNGYEISAGGRSTDSFDSGGGRGEARVTYQRWVASPAFPYVVERTHVRSGTGTSIACNMPSAIEVGDLLVIVAGCDIDSDLTVAGWTKLGQAVTASSTNSLAVFYKTAAGGDTATLSASSSTRMAAFCYQIRNGGALSWSTDSNINGTDANPPNHTFTNGNYLILAAACWDSSSLVTLSGFPSGYESLRVLYPFASTGIVLACCDRKVTGTSEDPGAYTSTIEQWVTGTIAIRAA